VDAPALVALLAGRRVAVLTGAGLSTDSGIPDYRGPDSPPANPMTIRQFTTSVDYRRRYWARNHVGWRRMAATEPNAGHRALAELERAGVVVGVITQNVDLLHTGATMSRAALADMLEEANPGFTERAEAGALAVAPDADAVVADTDSFRFVDCPSCAGMLKPDIVYFGESVAKEVVEQSYSMVDSAEALLVAGSSLTVFSGYRFVRHAAASGIPIAIVNRGPTRGDDLATVKVEAGCSPMLVLLAEELAASEVMSSTGARPTRPGVGDSG
jgi:NAD-dependent SIR2 family protein deacetylase